MKEMPHPIIVYGFQSSKCLQEQGVCLSAVGTNDLYLTLVSALCSKPVLYPVQETLGPAVVDFASQQSLVKVDHFRFFLLIVF